MRIPTRVFTRYQLQIGIIRNIIGVRNDIGETH